MGQIIKIRFVFCLLFFCLTHFSFSQSSRIKAIEYYIDKDTVSNYHKTISFNTPKKNLDDFEITDKDAVSNLSPGMHTVSVRTQDTLGFWSTYKISSFVIADEEMIMTNKDKRTPIQALEYYIDKDTVSNYHKIKTIDPPTSNLSIDISKKVATSLSTGMHTVSVRTQDTLGFWSTYKISSFVVIEDEESSITGHQRERVPIQAIEYYVDKDTLGNYHKTISFSPPLANLDKYEISDDSISSLPIGTHKISVRTQDTLGFWSIYKVSLFVIAKNDELTDFPLDSASKFVGLEYWFNTLDNEIGQAKSKGRYIEFDSALTSIKDFDFETLSIPSTLPLGEHAIGIRFKQENGAWSHTQSVGFDICIDPEETPTSAEGNTLCNGTGTTTIKSEGSPTKEYAWYDIPSGGIAKQIGKDSTYSQKYTESTYMFVATKGELCNSNRLPVFIDVRDSILAPVINSAIHCGPKTFDFAPTGKPIGGTYEWFYTDTSTTAFYKGDVFTQKIDSTTSLYVGSITNDKVCTSIEKTNLVVAIESCKQQAIVFPKIKNAIFGIDQPQKLLAYSQDENGNKTGLPIFYEIIEGKDRAEIRNDSIFYKGIGIVKVRALQPGDTNYIYYSAVSIVTEFSIFANATDVAIVHNSPICAGNKLTLIPTLINDTLVNQNDYLWEGPNNFTSTKKEINILPISQADSGRYKLQVITPYDTLISSVVIKVKPQASPIYMDIIEEEKCKDKIYHFIAKEATFETYNWLLNSVLINTDSDKTDSIYTPLFTGIYSVIGIDSNDCSSESKSHYVDLTKDSLPIITYASNELSVQNAEAYQWYVNELYIQGATNKTLPVIVNGTYKVVTTNQEGCTYVSQPYVINESTLPTIDLTRSGSINLNEFKKLQELYVAPNPINKEKIIVHLTYSHKGSLVNIYNHQGILVHQEKIISDQKTLEISANELVQGLYIIELIGQTYNYKTTFIK